MDLGIIAATPAGDRLWMGEFGCKCHFLANRLGHHGRGYTQFYFRCQTHAHLGRLIAADPARGYCGTVHRVLWPVPRQQVAA